MALENPSTTNHGRISKDHPLADTVEAAYRVFSVPRPTSTEVCEQCCMNPTIEADFFNPAIRDLPLEYVQDWFSGACSTNGISKHMSAYLLPRVFEILASGCDPSSIGVEVSLLRFKTGLRDRWSQAEWEVIDRFQHEFLIFKIYHGEVQLDDILCMFRRAGWALDDLIKQVMAMPDDALAARFWQDWCAFDCDSVWMTTFWEKDESAVVHDFYTSAELYARMERLALDDTADRETAEKASRVADVIRTAANW